MAVTTVRGVALCPEWELGNTIHTARLVDSKHQSAASLTEGRGFCFSAHPAGTFAVGVFPFHLKEPVVGLALCQ